MKTGSPLRVESRREGVSIGLGQLPRWSTPARALPLLHAFTANFMLCLSLAISGGEEDKKVFLWILLFSTNNVGFCSYMVIQNLCQWVRSTQPNVLILG